MLSDIESDDGGDEAGRKVSNPEGSVDTTDDQLLQHMLRKRRDESFQSLEDIKPSISEYKRVSGNDLKVKKTLLILFVCMCARVTRTARIRSSLGSDPTVRLP